jgi:hypothetical protein
MVTTIYAAFGGAGAGVFVAGLWALLRDSRKGMEASHKKLTDQTDLSHQALQLLKGRGATRAN